jgi:hypothetical protein
MIRWSLIVLFYILLYIFDQHINMSREWLSGFVTGSVILLIIIAAIDIWYIDKMRGNQ